jgi:hypothetical protein
MALAREQIEHFEHFWSKDRPWKNLSYSRRWLKKQVNKYIRIKSKKINDDDIGGKIGRKPLCGWEY